MLSVSIYNTTRWHFLLPVRTLPVQRFVVCYGVDDSGVGRGEIRSGVSRRP